jgi:DNA replication and repair protein RecF
VSAPRVTRLGLQDFRSYRTLDLKIAARLVALVGENGAGKTNLLEALSLFCPGRGLRRAEWSSLPHRDGAGGFAISLDLDDGAHRLGLGSSPGGEALPRQRLARIDGEDAGSSAAFADHLRLVWLTPEIDGLFRGSAGERRRFLDRLVLAMDAGHGSRSAALERALRTRNRLLAESPDEGRWLDAVEREVAELGVAVALARHECVRHLKTLIEGGIDPGSAFPWASISLQGEFDDLVTGSPAVTVEEHYRQALRDMRQRDRGAGRTLMGPQASEFAVAHGPKGIPAALGSTGEQKALIIGLVMAHAKLVRRMCGTAPVMLLDEVAAHLDPARREALYRELDALGAQVWMTGTDEALFESLGGEAQRLAVRDGTVLPA